MCVFVLTTILPKLRKLLVFSSINKEEKKSKNTCDYIFYSLTLCQCCLSLLAFSAFLLLLVLLFYWFFSSLFLFSAFFLQLLHPYLYPIFLSLLRFPSPSFSLPFHNLICGQNTFFIGFLLHQRCSFTNTPIKIIQDIPAPLFKFFVASSTFPM